MIVAPRAGAWIETFGHRHISGVRGQVAPRAGAWIETPVKAIDPGTVASRPARARGLKRNICNVQNGKGIVAPRAGAWIETR